MLANGPISFMVSFQSLTAQITINRRGACSSSVYHKEDSVLRQHDGEAIIRESIHQRIVVPWQHYNTARCLEVAEDGKIPIHYLNAQDQVADLCTKQLGRYRNRALIKLINDVKARTITIAGFRRCHFSGTLLLINF